MNCGNNYENEIDKTLSHATLARDYHEYIVAYHHFEAAP